MAKTKNYEMVNNFDNKHKHVHRGTAYIEWLLDQTRKALQDGEVFICSIKMMVKFERQLHHIDILLK